MKFVSEQNETRQFEQFYKNAYHEKLLSIKTGL